MKVLKLAFKNRIDIIPILCLLFFILPLFSFAQVKEFHFSNITVKNGLSHNWVTSFCQDRKGFIWIGTMNGLNRYDGYNFIIYKNNPLDSTSISDNSISSIYEDKNGIIWIGTEKGGINKYDPKSDVFTHLKNDPKNAFSLSHNKINFITADKHNNLWIATQNGLNKLSNQEKNKTSPRFTIFLHDNNDPNSITDNAVFSIMIDSNDLFWLSLYQGFGIDKLKFTDDSYTKFNKTHLNSKQNNLSGDWILFTFWDSKGRLWISTWADGITLYEPLKNKYTHIRYNPSKQGSINCNDIENIIEDKEGNIWIATFGGGLNRYIEPTAKSDGFFVNYTFKRNSNFDLADNRILKLFQDKSGIIWIGTAAHGICKFTPKTQFFNIRLTDNKTDKDYSPAAIAKTSDGNLWVGTKEGIIFRFSSSYKTNGIFKLPTKIKPRINSSFITSFFEDESGTFWITTDGDGIFYILKNSLSSIKPVFNHVEQVKSNPETPFPNNFGFARENYKKDLVFGSISPINTWILSRDNKLGKKFSFNYFDYKNYCWSYENDGEAAWFGSFSHGVAKTDFATSKRYFSFNYSVENPFGSKNLPEGNVFSILKASDNSVWFATSKSLSRLLPNCDTLIHYTSTNGIANELVYGILEDNNKNIWISTYNGLSKINEKAGIITNYFDEDGIQGNEFFQYSYYKDKKGLLYFGGTNGVTVINPFIDSLKTADPRVEITGLYFSNTLQENKSLIWKGIIEQSISYAGEINLPSTQNEFVIEFSSLDYYDSQKTQYMYKLEGFDNDWIIAKPAIHIATYMNLPHGSYTFKVRAANKEGSWSNRISELKIIINPPFWKTLWFQLSSFLFVIGILVTFYKMRSRAYKKKQMLLQELIDEKTLQLRESNAALESFSYSVSHDLKAPLRIINNFSRIIKEDYSGALPDEATKLFIKINTAASRMGELIEGILKLARLSSTELKKTEVNLSQLAENSLKYLTPAYPDNKIVPNIQSGIKVRGDYVLLNTVIDNLLSNACKFSSKNEIITIDFGKTKEFDKSKSSSEEVFYVKDYGAGFDMNYSHKLFHVFQRLHDMNEFEGTGIGLANVKKIINRHGGVIWAESEIGKGTTFFFTLP